MKGRFYLALFVSKSMVSLVKLFRLRGGSDIFGKLAFKICPDFLMYFKNIDYSKTILITGTNGKSTTSTMIVSTLEKAGYKVASNREGANLTTGIATVILKNSSWLGSFQKDYLVLESDERYLAQIYNYVPAKYLIITNIQKDQQQRNGTPEFIYNKIAETVKKVDTVFLNGNEPNSLSFKNLANNYIVYSVDKNAKTYQTNNESSYTMACYNCSNRIVFDYYNLDKIGKFNCSSCDFSSIDGQYKVEQVDFEHNTFMVNGNTYHMTYNQEYFLYSYGVCVGICTELGLTPTEIGNSLKNFVNLDGRVEKLRYIDDNGSSLDIKFSRIKQENAETLQSAIDFIGVDNEPKTVLLALDVVDDFTPSYVNNMYVYEVDFSRISHDDNAKVICFGTVISNALKMRLKYNGFKDEDITIVDNDDSIELLKELQKPVYGENIYLVCTLGRYEKMRLKLGDKVQIIRE